QNGEKKELVDEVVVLAKKHGIATPYTSYLVVPDGTPRPQLASDQSNNWSHPSQFNVPVNQSAQPGFNFTGSSAAPRINYAPAATYENVASGHGYATRSAPMGGMPGPAPASAPVPAPMYFRQLATYDTLGGFRT